MAARHRRHNAVTYPVAPSFLYCWTVIALHTQTSSGHQTSPAGGSLFCIVCITDGHKNSHRHVKGAVQVRSDPPAEQLSPAVPFNCYPPSFPWAPHIITLSSAHVHTWTLPARVTDKIQITISLPIPQCKKKKKGNCKSLKMSTNTRHRTKADVLKGVPKWRKEQTKSWKNELVHVLVWLDST